MDKYAEIGWRDKPDDINDALATYRARIEELEKERYNCLKVALEEGTKIAKMREALTRIAGSSNLADGDDESELRATIRLAKSVLKEIYEE